MILNISICLETKSNQNVSSNSIENPLMDECSVAIIQEFIIRLSASD